MFRELGNRPVRPGKCDKRQKSPLRLWQKVAGYPRGWEMGSLPHTIRESHSQADQSSNSAKQNTEKIHFGEQSYDFGVKKRGCIKNYLNLVQCLKGNSFQSSTGTKVDIVKAKSLFPSIFTPQPHTVSPSPTVWIQMMACRSYNFLTSKMIPMEYVEDFLISVMMTS